MFVYDVGRVLDVEAKVGVHHQAFLIALGYGAEVVCVSGILCEV